MLSASDISFPFYVSPKTVYSQGTEVILHQVNLNLNLKNAKRTHPQLALQSTSEGIRLTASRQDMSCICLDSDPACRNLFEVFFCGLTRSKPLAGEMGIFLGCHLPPTLPTCNASHTLALGISVKSKSAHGRGHRLFWFLATSPGYFFAPCHQRAQLHGVARESIS